MVPALLASPSALPTTAAAAPALARAFVADLARALLLGATADTALAKQDDTPAQMSRHDRDLPGYQGRMEPQLPVTAGLVPWSRIRFRSVRPRPRAAGKPHGRPQEAKHD
jgi:hypothetical protein